MKFNLIDKSQKISFLREIKILSECNNPCIINLLGWTLHFSIENPSPAIALPYMENGSVLHAIVCEGKGYCPSFWDSTTKMKTIFGLTGGLYYLHSNGIIHRDLKPDNILLDSECNPFITDFGLSKEINSNSPNLNSAYQVGTLNYMAPEVLSGAYYSFPADVYSFGLTIYAILMYEIPYNGDSKEEIRRKINQNILPEMTGIPPDFLKLIVMCCAFNPKDRPTFLQILEFLKACIEKNSCEFFLDETDQDDLNAYIQRILGNNFCKKVTNPISELEQNALNDSSAALELALMYKHGKTVGKDIVLSQYYLELSASKGNHIAQRKLGSLSYQQNNVYLAFSYLQQAAEVDAKAARMYGVMLIKGEGCFKNRQEGIKFLRIAAEMNDVKALKNISKFVKKKQFFEKGFSLPDIYTRLIALGDVQSMRKLGSLYIKDKECSKNMAVGAELLRQASELGDTKALRMYALCLISGKGVENNFLKGIDYLKQAASKGDPKSMINYGVMLTHGAGCFKNSEKGQKLIEDGTKNLKSNRKKDTKC